MGNLVGKVVKRAGRPLKNFAVEARTERILAKEKPTPAPWHPSTQKKIEELMKNTEIVEEKKNTSLDDNLKKVFVTSHDDTFPKTENPNKPLPRSRENVESPELGYQEPNVVMKGKLSIRQALLLIGRHQHDSTINSAASLAQEFTINPQHAENILKYFKTFDLYEPPRDKKDKNRILVSDFMKYRQLTPPSKESPQIEEKSKT